MTLFASLKRCSARSDSASFLRAVRGLLAEEAAGLLGGVDLEPQVLLDVQLREGVRQQGRELRVVRPGLHVDEEGVLHRLDGDPPEDRRGRGVDARLVSCALSPGRLAVARFAAAAELRVLPDAQPLRHRRRERVALEDLVLGVVVVGVRLADLRDLLDLK